MSHTLARVARFIEDFRFYFGKGYTVSAAWRLASMPMP